MTDTIGSMPARIDQQQLAQQLVDSAREDGVELVGPGGLLTGLTKTVLETALEAELDEHLGYEKHQIEGRDGGNSRNGTRPKTVLTEIGPVQIEVPRDRDGSFDPQLVRKRQRRLSGIDEIVLSLTARGLTTGEVAAHFAEVYGAKVSKDTISKITDKVLEEMTEWAQRPLDAARILVVVANPDREDSGCHATRRTSLTGDKEALLRADPVGSPRRRGGAPGRRVAELWIGVVRRRWPGVLRRETDQLALSEPGRSNRDRRRHRAKRTGQGDRRADREELSDRVSRD
jgi:hypothetical protein